MYRFASVLLTCAIVVYTIWAGIFFATRSWTCFAVAVAFGLAFMLWQRKFDA